uniref:LAGLIDADG endonuclease n=1 Tax=Dichomitus squalens TaxID=114155 RepID=UPI003001A85C
PTKILYTFPVVATASISPFRFDKFNKLYPKRFPNAELPSQSFLEWFVGFTEGDGSFIVNSRGTAIFVITQGNADLQVLEYIKNTLGFGRVIKQGVKTSRLIIEDKANIQLLIAIFNGNLVFPTKQNSFALFLNAFNTKSQDLLIKLNPLLVIPTFFDSWLSGFTDAEGCFTCSLLGNSTAYRFRFLLAQLGNTNLSVLTHITTIIGGVVRPHSQPEVNELVVNGVSNMYQVFKYFDRHLLKSKKANSYRIWGEIHVALLNKEHLSTESRAVLKAKAATVNRTQ